MAKIKKGTKVKWNDPAIHEYPEEEREFALNRVFEVVSIKGDIILITDGYTEVETTLDEIEKC
jgi:hypothetical protein